MSRRLLVLGGAATAALALAANASRQDAAARHRGDGARRERDDDRPGPRRRRATRRRRRSRSTCRRGTWRTSASPPARRSARSTPSAQGLMLSPDAVAVPGTIVTDTPASYSRQCTCAPGLHAAVWLLHLDVQGTTLDVPVFVDPTTGRRSAVELEPKLVLCLPNPYEQAQPPGTRAPAGCEARRREADAERRHGHQSDARPGAIVWRSRDHAVDRERREPKRAGDDRGAGDRNDPVVAVAQGEGANDRAAGRRVTNSVLLSGKVLESLTGRQRARRIAFFANGKSAGSAIDRGCAAPSRSKSGLTKHDDVQGDGDGADARDGVREPAPGEPRFPAVASPRRSPATRSRSSTVTVTTEEAVSVAVGPPRNLQLGRRRAPEELVSARGAHGRGAAAPLRRAVRHGRGRLAVLPPAVAGDRGALGRADARRDSSSTRRRRRR